MPKHQRGRPPHDDLLTPAEWRVLYAVQHGLTNRAIAARMGVSINAVKYHVGNLLAKTGLGTKAALRLMFKAPRNSNLARLEQYVMNTAALYGIGQIARTVNDIEQSRHWYEQVLELSHLFTFGTLSFFDCGGTRLMLSQNEAFNANESLLYFKVTDIVGAQEKLLNKGVEFIAAPHLIHRHKDGTEEWMAFFKDLEGRPLALMAQLSTASVPEQPAS